MIPAVSRSLPESLYSADAVRAIDRYVIGQCQVPGFELMQRAASSVFRNMIKVWPEPGRLLVLCGAGNNGGDGYLVAASAVRHGLDVDCVAVTDPERLKGDALKAYQAAVGDGVGVRLWRELDEGARAVLFATAGLIVDGMLGTGVTGAPRAPFDDLIRRCNASLAPVLAIDLPSGLDATTGHAAGDVVRAVVTVTFIGLKTGLLTGQGSGCSGQVVFESLETEPFLDSCGEQPTARRVDWWGLRSRLPVRSAAAHKGHFGHLLIVSGDRGFGGAALLAAEAAIRSGAGLVTLATRPEHVMPALARCPSVMAQGVIHGSELVPMLSRASIVVCGPGLGQSSWGQQMLQQVVTSGKPQVLDADALNLLSQRVPVTANNHILTPHPGEAARLLGMTSAADVEEDRVAAAIRIQQEYGGTVLLKGAGTVITDGRETIIISGGNPGMATGGMGDVLSGMIGSLLAQVATPLEAATLAATLHLACADRASESKGYMGLIPTDVIDTLPLMLAEAERLSERRLREGLQGIDDAVDGE
ncbi:NAD(P)H-hydrate dehydratase [Marinobacter zhejiangensis]|uniref:Bifunctional NAD(P)H-hydrate repair enzyme n=1 Tax=Marinobacter zhejiangensis TaxID=488535 RepID=A0A1I4QHW0_9GAMM|nr:NAD(P)H-hydrate dehydratase [Marinobacter zhejiangensis]SFM39659.1 NAD(P)H-hydrate epimerase [Marinobacter zhejiangensis]